jgi:hypothetical protein
MSVAFQDFAENTASSYQAKLQENTYKNQILNKRKEA